MTNKYNPNDALDQQANDFEIENVSQSSACNEPANDNVSPKEIKISHCTKNLLPIDLGQSNLDQLHQIIVSRAVKINLLDYIKKMGGDPAKYLKDGHQRIPLSIIAVIAKEYTIKLINNLGYSIGQLYSLDAETKAGYLFNGKYWMAIGDSFIKNLVRSILVAIGYDPVEAQTNGLGELLIKTFWTTAPKAPERDNNRILINLANGTLEIMPSGEIKQIPFNRDNFLLYCLPYQYQPQANCSKFIKYLDRVLPDKASQAVLQELLGSIFVKNIKLEKMGILLGSGANGKSVLLDIVTALLGTNNVSQMDLKSLTTDANAPNNRAQLMGKLLNFAPEINAKGEQSHDLIKRLSSGEAVQAKILYKDTFTMTDYAKLIFNANSLPTDVEHTHGYFRRFLIVDFDQTISDAEKDPQLASKIIKDELPAVLNWVIEGAQRLQKNKQFSQCKKSEDILEHYKLDSDAVALWLADRNYVPHDYLTKLLKDLYVDFQKYSHESGLKCPSDRTMSKRLKLLKFKVEKPSGYPSKVYITVNNNIVSNNDNPPF